MRRFLQARLSCLLIVLRSCFLSFFAGAGVNGVGYGLWKTTDNWQTYTTTAFSNALILTDVASFGTNVQVVGSELF